MKILSKYKDYYDHLKGIYGEDPLLFLDRTSSNSPVPYSTWYDREISIFIGEWVIQAILLKNGSVKFADDLREFVLKPKTKKLFSWSIDNKFNAPLDKLVQIRTPMSFDSCFWILKEPFFLGEKSPTWEMDCPILLNFSKDGKVYLKFPHLKSWGINRVLSPEQVWLYLSDWLGRRNTHKEKTVPIGDDKLRIQSHGFDVKTSFRNIK